MENAYNNNKYTKRSILNLCLHYVYENMREQERIFVKFLQTWLLFVQTTCNDDDNGKEYNNKM